MKKGALNILLPMLFVISFWDIAEAGGAAARRQGIRVHRTIRPALPPEPSPDHPDAPRPDEEEEIKKPKKTSASGVYRQPRVLKSSASSESRVISSAPAVKKVQPAASIEEELARVFSYLRNSSEIWTQINDNRIKMLIIGRYIDLYRQEGVLIRKPALYYAQLIDSMARENPAMLRQPFDRVLQMAAIVEYDFNNGQNKDALALQILGSREAVVKNRQRLMEQGR